MRLIPDATARFYPVLLLDFDSRDAYRAFPERARFAFRWLFGNGPFDGWRIRRRRSTHGGFHIIVYSSRVRFTPRETVALQAILGSDYRREVFNFIRANTLHDAPESWQRVGRWNTLYREKFNDDPAGKH